jgi:ABC-type Fe3+ transport system substrate-binding protein
VLKRSNQVTIGFLKTRRFETAKRFEPHPTAAKLFAEWLLSPEGQAAIDAVGRPSARKGFKSKTSIENGWGPNVKPIVASNKAYIEDARKWLDTAVKPVWEN